MLSKEAGSSASQTEYLEVILKKLDTLENLLNDEVVENDVEQLLSITTENLNKFKEYVKSIRTDNRSYVYNLIKATPLVRGVARSDVINKVEELFKVWWGIADSLTDVVSMLNNQSLAESLKYEFCLRAYNRLKKDHNESSNLGRQESLNNLNGQIKALLLGNPEFTKNLLAKNDEEVKALILSDPEFFLGTIMTFFSTTRTLNAEHEELVKTLTSTNQELNGQVDALTSIKKHIEEQCSSVRMTALGVAAFASAACIPLIATLVISTTITAIVCAAVALAAILVPIAITVHMLTKLNPDNIAPNIP